MTARACLQVYLCLPPHRSLTDGHCLIVPMQHVAQATVLDEDVWQEIQVNDTTTYLKANIHEFRRSSERV